MPYNDYDPDDPDAPQPMDVDRSDETADEAVPCPNCRRPIHEDAAVCPYCGEWLLDDSPAAQRSRGWFWPLACAESLPLALAATGGPG